MSSLQLQHTAIIMQNTAQTAHREINKYLFVDYVNPAGFLSKRVLRKRIFVVMSPRFAWHVFFLFACLNSEACYQIHVTIVRGITKRIT